MKYLTGACAVSLIWSTAAQAGDDVIYQSEPPEWTVSIDDSDFLTTRDDVPIYNRQLRAEEGGKTSAFFDVAFRMGSQQMVQSLGTLKLSWFPDKGDLIVHALEIWRDGERIDLIAEGARLEVLRREANLEKRLLDGKLTATLAIPGLRVGDVLRYSGTITNADQALGGDFQMFDRIFADPAKIDRGRLILSWPSARAVQWKAVHTDGFVEERDKGGYHYVTITMPVAEVDDMPKDAPARLRLIPHVQATSFASWPAVSRLMNGHFSTQGTIDENGPIAKRVAQIMAESADPKRRAAAALKIVQDEISYLLNGMNGGNYLPQSPEETWQLKYGDCKAKTLLLLAMLRRMGIEAEAALVRSSQGDSIAAYLPALQAFDHVIVRAQIDGKQYWLDGTLSGTRIDTLDELPSAGYALPLTEAGSDLVAIPSDWQSWSDNETYATYDFTAGLDMPALADITLISRARAGARLREAAAGKDADEIRRLAEQEIKKRLGEYVIYDAAIAYDDALGVARVTAKALMGSPWEWERGKGSLKLNLESTGYEFKPDRARAEWRDLPVALAGPLTKSREIRLRLPQDATRFDVRGLSAFDDVVANMKVTRKLTRDGEQMIVFDRAAFKALEIPAEAIPAQRAAASRLRAGDPVVKAPSDAARYWQIDRKTALKRGAHLIEAADRVIAEKDDEAWRYSTRAAVREYLQDLEGAIADYTLAIDLEASPALYLDRASLYRETGDYAAAIADAEQAYALDPSSDRAVSLAEHLANAKRLDEAFALLDALDPAGEERVSVISTKAQILGEMGRKDEAWQLLEELALERPGDGEVLNAQCWYIASWVHALDRGDQICDQAVRKLDYSAIALDSRALMKWRKGEKQGALEDLNAALSSNPGFGPSLYLRGVIRSLGGESGAKEDIAQALRIDGDYRAFYARRSIAPR